MCWARRRRLPDRVLSGLRGELVGRVGGADVVRLVDHDQDRFALVPSRHRSPSTAAAIRDCSSRAGSEPRSMTTQRVPSSCTVSRTEQVSPGAHTVKRSTPRLRRRRARGRVSGPALPGSASSAELSGCASNPASVAYFSRSAIGVQPEHGRLRRRIDLGRVDSQPPVPRGIGRKDGDAVPYRSQAHEVRVRIEDDQAQVRLGQQTLEDHSERVGLARPRLTAQERVPVEAVGVRQAGHVGDRRQFTQPQLRAGPRAALEPCSHLRPTGRTDRHVVERHEVAVEDDTFAARIPDQHLRPVPLGAVGGCWQHQFGAQLVEVKRDELAEARGAAGLEYDVAAGLQPPAVQGGLKENRRPSTEVASGRTDASSSRRASRKPAS
jgi:hypothetical protein